MGYSGKADWDFIKSLKEKLRVPLVGNGDLLSSAQADELTKKGYCDSFMVARAAMGNPMIFSGRSPEGLEGRSALIREYADIHRKYLGEIEMKDIKMKAVNFISGAPGAAAMRNRICRAAGVEEILSIGEERQESPSAV